MRRFDVLLLHALPFVLLAGSLGCAGDGVTPPPATAEFDIIQRSIFNLNCLSAGCHNSQSRAGNMDLSPGASFDQLVGQLPDNPTAREQGLLRVEPFNAENSFLLVKLTGPGPGEGSRMPRDQPPLAGSDIELIRDWILNGAPQPVTPEASPTATATPDGL